MYIRAIPTFGAKANKNPEHLKIAQNVIASQFGQKEAVNADSDLFYIRDTEVSQIRFMYEVLKDVIDLERTLKSKVIPANGTRCYILNRYNSTETAAEAVIRLRNVIRQEQEKENVGGLSVWLRKILLPATYCRNHSVDRDDDDIVQIEEVVVMRKKIMPTNQ